MSSPHAQSALDANVILRYVLDDDEELSAKAKGILQAVERGEIVVTCDPVTLAEVVWVLSSYYKLPNQEISEGLGPIIKAEGILMPEKERYVLALDLYANVIRHFGDACACATALRECEGRLYSFDRKLSSVPGIHRSEAWVPPEAD